jgi:preprotein translocase subunit YajC
MCSLEEMGFDFSRCAVADYNPSWFVVKNCSASECIEKIRQYEQEKEEQIQVGDEVIIRDKKAVVTEITDRFVRIMYSDGSGYALFSKNMTKTGRNFSEIAEVLRKMKENE